jgi:hypothetical protein
MKKSIVQGGLLMLSQVVALLATSAARSQNAASKDAKHQQ